MRIFIRLFFLFLSIRRIIRFVKFAAVFIAIGGGLATLLGGCSLLAIGKAVTGIFGQ